MHTIVLLNGNYGKCSAVYIFIVLCVGRSKALPVQYRTSRECAVFGFIQNSCCVQGSYHFLWPTWLSLTPLLSAQKPVSTGDELVRTRKNRSPPAHAYEVPTKLITVCLAHVKYNKFVITWLFSNCKRNTSRYLCMYIYYEVITNNLLGFTCIACRHVLKKGSCYNNKKLCQNGIHLHLCLIRHQAHSDHRTGFRTRQSHENHHKEQHHHYSRAAENGDVACTERMEELPPCSAHTDTLSA